MKIASLNELNDPFEFFSVNLSDLSLRGAFHAMKAEIAKKAGLYISAVIGTTDAMEVTTLPNIQEYVPDFEIPDEHLGAISYSRKRLIIETEDFEILMRSILMPSSNFCIPSTPTGDMRKR
ncbi:MAG: hypothetical protein MZU95_17020 [Desulfomicrobium escambiense]|nr:hypothetical protein [Desulfomicrobium escambiense]